MIFSPKGFNQLALKYAHLKKVFVFLTVALFVMLMAFAISNSSNESKYVFLFITINFALFFQCFCITGFLFYFNKLDSSVSINPFWFKLTVIKEWTQVIMFTGASLTPLLMIIGVTYGVITT